jgi:hypothetical protein
MSDKLTIDDIIIKLIEIRRQYPNYEIDTWITEVYYNEKYDKLRFE